jgi:hypothetical protein
LPSKHKALNSNPSTAKKGRRTRRKGEKEGGVGKIGPPPQIFSEVLSEDIKYKHMTTVKQRTRM